jgi:hypothetical protein
MARVSQGNIAPDIEAVQAKTALAQKLARVVFALFRNQSDYDLQRRLQSQVLMT